MRGSKLLRINSIYQESLLISPAYKLLVQRFSTSEGRFGGIQIQDNENKNRKR